MLTSLLSPPLLLLCLLLAPSPSVMVNGCCDCDCGCDSGMDLSLLAAMLGGTSGLSLGRRRREAASTNMGGGQQQQKRDSASAEPQKQQQKQFRFGKDDPTPHLMGWRIEPGRVRAMAPPRGSQVDEWYRRAFADERERRRQQAKLRQKPSPLLSSNSSASSAANSWHRRHRRLAQLMHEAIQQAVRFRRIRAQQFGALVEGHARANKTKVTAFDKEQPQHNR